ncbi:hypothetical protein KSP39_PZI000021 [Platanthera zijinensis]|uniref:Reverse transcriptase/retrotransposon-derived protein RNase H-like domain-containing protein n=1 Tax=Platanthera zijinensis TaxID=2320716 RepID=A0AAP0GFR8_9ASPA
MAEFIDDLVKFRSPLTNQLKKEAPPWNDACTNAVKKLKSLSKDLPPLQIPSSGRRILQTDASDHFWGVILLEELNGKRRICGYKSGAFKSGELHYHSTYKEILVVKRGIEKFQFHLIGQHFLIEMDMSAFPKMLHFKQNMLPQAQLLRWANWFSQWKFDAQYIKGKNNFLPDFLSRTQRTISMIFPVIYHFQPVDLPSHIQHKLLHFLLRKRSLSCLLIFQKIYISKHGLDNGPLATLPFHPVLPFLTILQCKADFYYDFPKEAYMVLWYFIESCPFGMIFDKGKLLQYIAQNDVYPCKPQHRQLLKWLSLFGDTSFWRKNLRPEGNSLNGVREQKHVLIHFRCQQSLRNLDTHIFIHKQYSCTFWHDYEYSSPVPTIAHKALLCTINGVPITDVPLGLPTAYWRNTGVLPLQYIDEIQHSLHRFQGSRLQAPPTHRSTRAYDDVEPSPFFTRGKG